MLGNDRHRDRGCKTIENEGKVGQSAPLLRVRLGRPPQPSFPIFFGQSSNTVFDVLKRVRANLVPRIEPPETYFQESRDLILGLPRSEEHTSELQSLRH